MVAVAGSAAADPCANLASLNLVDITITAAQTIPAGNYTATDGNTYNNLPTFCRVAATAVPTSQSDINFEVWMPPAGTWNGIFRGEGSGGSAGAITFPLMANAIQRNYATMSNDNGHTGKQLVILGATRAGQRFRLSCPACHDRSGQVDHPSLLSAGADLFIFLRLLARWPSCADGGAALSRRL
jgi:hypothetical protein